jgi:PAS domain S-box-containing protein
VQCSATDVTGGCIVRLSGDRDGDTTVQHKHMRSSQDIKREIHARFGFVPAYYEPAELSPPLLDSLWQQCRVAYLDNPLPRLFKERAATCVSLQSRSRYSLRRHCCQLHALGARGSEILGLLEAVESLIAARIDEHAAILAIWSEAPEMPEEIETWPEPDSPREHALLAAACLDCADPHLALALRPLLQRILGPVNYCNWVAFLGFLRVCQQWVLSYPELMDRQDEPVQQRLPEILAEEPALARFLELSAPRGAATDRPAAGAPEGHTTEARLAAILDSAPLAIIEIDESGTIGFANAHTARIFGYTIEELIGQSVEMLLPEHYRHGHEALRQGFFAAPSVRMMGSSRNVRGRRRDGSEFLVEIGLAPISSQPAGVVATIADISERARAQEALRRVSAARERLSHMFSGGAGSKVQYGEVLDFLLELFDSEYGFFGYLDEQGNLVCPSMTRKIWDACQVEHKAIVFPRHAWGGLWGQVLHEKRCLIKNEAHTVPAGHLPLHRSVGAPLMYRGELIGSLHLANRGWDYDELDARVLQAIADQIAPLLAAWRAEDELRRSNADLEHFASVASHDLQEPLRTVTSFAELLENRYASQLDERGNRYMRAIREGADRMQRLVRDMLAVARPGGGPGGGSRSRAAGHARCSEIVDHVLADLQASMTECGAQITRDELPDVPVERSQLAQLFKNLLSNAIKFRGDRPPRIHVSTQRHGHQWQFSVADNGIGIAPEHTTAVFEMFQRVHDRSRYPGSGIGLAVAKRIIERHGGQIWFESEPGRGTTFHFTVPAQRD